jgi:hypothetical protein
VVKVPSGTADSDFRDAENWLRHLRT